MKESHSATRNAPSGDAANRLPLLVAAIACGLLGSPAAGAEPPAQPAGARPNVVVLLIDDLGRSDVGVDGATFYETPRIDALAKSGVRFTNFYAAHPVCSPTRAALMTGKQPQRLGITDWIHPSSGVALPPAEVTLGQAFQAHGYQTAYLGKWHLGEADAEQPGRRGFEWTKGVNRAGQPGSYHHPFKRQAGKDSIWDVPDFADGPPSDYLTDALTTGAIEFLRQRDPARPFLLCLAQYAVHTPIQPPAGLPKKYRDKRARLHGDSATPTLPEQFDAVTRGRQDNPDYAAMMENLDTNVGRILATLDELKLRDNTIVVFTSDNGGLGTQAKAPGPTCNLPWRAGKGWNYEGGIRIATSISWPGRLNPSVTDTPGYTADFYPTLLDLCGLPLQPDQHLDGRSLASALRGSPGPALADRPLAWYYPHNHGSGHKASAAIRRGPWKLIYFLKSEKSELYDLTTDPIEAKDLSSANPDKARELREELLGWIEKTNRLPGKSG